MKPDIAIQDLLFEVDQVPVEAVIGTNGHTRRINIPGKKALFNKRSGQVFDVVSRDYCVVTNQEAVDFARDACGIAFPGVSPTEWDAKRPQRPAPSATHTSTSCTAPMCSITGTTKSKRAIPSPLIRNTTNINGVIFEEEVATIKASHSKEALAQLTIEIKSRSLPKMWKEFTSFINRVRSITMTTEHSAQALKTVLRFADPKLDAPPERGVQHPRRRLRHLPHRLPRGTRSERLRRV